MAHEQEDLGRVAFATWVYLLHTSGIRAADGEVAGACDAVSGASEAKAGDAAGKRLLDRVNALFAGPSDPDRALAVAKTLYGDRAAADLGGGDRDSRSAAFRKYQFGLSLPWLARIWERSDGKVAPTWLLVEKVDGMVHAMDPNPWNDVDEERKIPVADFQVLWELDGCTSVLLR
jgi:hypothetical protein